MGRKKITKKAGPKYERGFIKKVIIEFLLAGQKNTTEIRTFLKDKYGLEEKTNVMRHLDDLIKRNIVEKISGETGWPDTYKLRNDYIGLKSIFNLYDEEYDIKELMNSEYFKELSLEMIIEDFPNLLLDIMLSHFIRFYEGRVKQEHNLAKVDLKMVLDFIANEELEPAPFSLEGSLNSRNEVPEEFYKQYQLVLQSIFMPPEEMCDFAHTFASPSVLRIILNIDKMIDDKKRMLFYSYLLYFFSCVEIWKKQKPEIQVDNFIVLIEAITTLEDRPKSPLLSLFQSLYTADYFENKLTEKKFAMSHIITQYIQSDEDRYKAYDCLGGILE